MTDGISGAGRGLVHHEGLIFERSVPGRVGHGLSARRFSAEGSAAADLPTSALRQVPPRLPELSEVDVVRHFVRLSRWNYAVDIGTYPLGSCTMKYNPKINEDMARLPGFAALHPYAPHAWTQGALDLMWRLERQLAAVSGLPNVTLQPAAGAHGEFTAVMMIRALIADRGEVRTKVLIPDSAHGTNPASVALNGYKVVQVPSGDDGLIDIDAVRAAMGPDVAAIMITNPNTLGLFESKISEIAEIIHEGGGFVYLDGANLNALMGKARPGDFGADVMHINLHKTFSTPHGGGGPGAGPVCVSDELAPYLPVPRVARVEAADGSVHFELQASAPLSVGRVKAFYGNFGMFVRAFTYITELGSDGLERATEMAVLNANYLRARLRGHYHIPFDRTCMHEVVLTDKTQKANGVSTMDVAKRLIDYGYHPPTVYFPLCVQGALMVEPTESESKAELDAFADALIAIAGEARDEPDRLHESPQSTHLGRLDEVTAARKPVLVAP